MRPIHTGNSISSFLHTSYSPISLFPSTLVLLRPPFPGPDFCPLTPLRILFAQPIYLAYLVSNFLGSSVPFFSAVPLVTLQFWTDKGSFTATGLHAGAVLYISRHAWLGFILHRAA